VPVQPIATLKANMPIGIVSGTSASDLADLVDTLEARTTQAVLPKTASYTASVDDNRCTITFDSAVPVTLTIPNNVPVGWECIVIQLGTGQVTVTVTGGLVRAAGWHTKLAGQWARVDLKVYENVSTSPQVSMEGNTAE
jgi:hypothetical protein